MRNRERNGAASALIGLEDLFNPKRTEQEPQKALLKDKEQTETTENKSINEDPLQMKIDSFIVSSKALCSQSNAHEFTETLFETARLDSKKIDRKSQMKSSVADNWDGPLARSIAAAAAQKRAGIPNQTSACKEREEGIITKHLTSITCDAKEKEEQEGTIDEMRLSVVESHLFKSEPKYKSGLTGRAELLSRIKACEDFIMRIENEFPAIASNVFYYGDDKGKQSEVLIHFKFYSISCIYLLER